MSTVTGRAFEHCCQIVPPLVCEEIVTAGGMSCLDHKNGDRDNVAVLAIAPAPSMGKTLAKAKIASALRRGGRKLRIEVRTEQIWNARRSDQLAQPPVIEDAYGSIVASLARLIAAHSSEIATLEEALTEGFTKHPAAEIHLSQPGFGVVTA